MFAVTSGSDFQVAPTFDFCDLLEGRGGFYFQAHGPLGPCRNLSHRAEPLSAAPTLSECLPLAGRHWSRVRRQRTAAKVIVVDIHYRLGLPDLNAALEWTNNVATFGTCCLTVQSLPSSTKQIALDCILRGCSCNCPPIPLTLREYNSITSSEKPQCTQAWPR